MTKIFTDIKQSQKLIELGIDVNTADMRYGYIAPYDFYDTKYDGGYDEIPYHKDFFNKNPDFSGYARELPAWSLSALMHLMPTHYVVEKCSDSYCCYNFSVKEFFASTAVDAAFEMVCWLKENKKI